MTTLLDRTRKSDDSKLEFIESLNDDYFLYDIAKCFHRNELPLSRFRVGISTDDLISIIDENVLYSTPIHYNLIQGAWFRDHEYLMKLQLSENESEKITHHMVVMDWVQNRDLQVGHHVEYAKKYIIGRPLAPQCVSFAQSRLKSLAEETDMSDYYSCL